MASHGVQNSRLRRGWTLRALFWGGVITWRTLRYFSLFEWRERAAPAGAKGHVSADGSAFFVPEDFSAPQMSGSRSCSPSEAELPRRCMVPLQGHARTLSFECRHLITPRWSGILTFECKHFISPSLAPPRKRSRFLCILCTLSETRSQLRGNGSVHLVHFLPFLLAAGCWKFQ